LTDWQQFCSENVSRLTLIAVPFCFHLIDKICSHNKTADNKAAEIKQNLLTESDDILATKIEQPLLLL